MILNLPIKYDEFFQEAYKYYICHIACSNSFDYSNIIYCDDICNDIKIFSSNATDIPYDSHGVMIWPYDSSVTTDKIVILIQPELSNLFETINTIFHELTHVHDFNIFLSQHCHNDFSEAKQHILYKPYKGLTEFRAHAYGYLYSYKFVDYYYKTNNFKHNIESYIANIPHYINKCRNKFINGELISYDLYSMLGYVSIIDISKNITAIQDSVIYKYMDNFFHEMNCGIIIDLYDLCYQSYHNNDDLSLLSEIYKLENRLFES